MIYHDIPIRMVNIPVIMGHITLMGCLILIIIWLVVWNMNFMTFHWEFHHPTDFHSIIFQRGWSTTNQTMINHH